jgi:CDP-paratose synthetase
LVTQPSSTILLTGGTGFLGRNLLKCLLSNGYSIVLLKRTSSRIGRIACDAEGLRAYNYDAPHWDRLFDENAIDLIVHCATNYGRGDVPLCDVVDTNLILPLQLLQLAKRHRVRGFINSDTVLDKRVSSYSLSKKQLLEWFPHFVEELACVNVALEHFYGPCDNPSKFVTWIIREMLRGAECIDLTPGRQKREFVFIDDVVRAYIRIIEFSLLQQRGAFRFDVGSRSRIEIKSMVELVKKLTGNTTTKLNFGAIPYRANEVMDSASNTAPLEALGWEALVPLERGLAETIHHERFQECGVK